MILVLKSYEILTMAILKFSLFFGKNLVKNLENLEVCNFRGSRGGGSEAREFNKILTGRP